MTETLTIHSPRLVLVAATVDLAKAERDGGERFATLLGAAVPADWPPPLNDEHSMNWMIELQEQNELTKLSYLNKLKERNEPAGLNILNEFINLMNLE